MELGAAVSPVNTLDYLRNGTSLPKDYSYVVTQNGIIIRYLPYPERSEYTNLAKVRVRDPENGKHLRPRLWIKTIDVEKLKRWLEGWPAAIKAARQIDEERICIAAKPKGKKRVGARLTAKERIVKALEEHGPLTPIEIAEKSGVLYDTVRKYIAYMAQDPKGRIEKASYGTYRTKGDVRTISRVRDSKTKKWRTVKAGRPAAEAVIEYMRAHPEKALFADMVKTIDAEYSTIAVTLMKMERAGTLVKVAKGEYRLPTLKEAALTKAAD